VKNPLIIGVMGLIGILYVSARCPDAEAQTTTRTVTSRFNIVQFGGKVAWRPAFAVEECILKDPGEVPNDALIRIAEGGWIVIQDTLASRPADSGIETGKTSTTSLKILGPIEFRANTDSLHKVSLNAVLSNIDLSKLQISSPEAPQELDWGFDLRDLWNLDLLSNTTTGGEKEAKDENFGLAKSTKKLRVLEPTEGQEFHAPFLPIFLSATWVDTTSDSYTSPGLRVRVFSESRDKFIELPTVRKNTIELKISDYDHYQIVVVEPSSGRASKPVKFSVKAATDATVTGHSAKRPNVSPMEGSIIVSKGAVDFQFADVFSTQNDTSGTLYKLNIKHIKSGRAYQIATPVPRKIIELEEEGEYLWTVHVLADTKNAYSGRFVFRRISNPANELEDAVAFMQTQLQATQKNTKNHPAENVIVFK